MAVIQLLVILFAIGAAIAAGKRRLPFGPMRLRTIAARAATPATIALPLAFAAQAALSYAQSQYDGAPDPWFALVPIPIVTVGRPFLEHHLLFSCGIQIAIVVQTLALAAIALGRVSPRRVALVAAALAVMSVCAPVVTSRDPYYYAVAGMRGFAQYRVDFHEKLPYQFLESHMLLRGSIYGPLWIWTNALVTSLGSTLQAKLVLIRIENAALMLACAALVRALRFPAPVRTAFLLNPMLWWYTVLNLHNDIFPIAFVLLAQLAVRAHRPALAVAAVAAAGAAKLPLLLIGVAVFTAYRSLPTRVAYACASVALCVLVSAIFGGRPYYHALVWYSTIPRGDEGVGAIRALAFGGGLLALAAAFFRRRFAQAAAFLMVGLTPLSFPWYFAWGVPYATAMRRGALTTLLFLPLVAMTWDGVTERTLPVAAMLIETYVVLKLRTTPKAA